MPRPRLHGWPAVALAGLVAGLWLLARPGPVPTGAPASEPTTRTWFRTDDEDLSALPALIRQTLDINTLEFPGRTGPVAGFGAGAAYPQVWLRDSATLVAVTRFAYPASHLTSWLEEHLRHQGAGGRLFDWIASGPATAFVAHAPRVATIHREGGIELSADRNSTESDQESSAVMAAHDAFTVLGDRGWLARDVDGVRLVDRLAAGLEYLLRERLDRPSGLIRSGLTADWGDVSPAHPDARAIYLDANTPEVVGLYTNSLFVEASRRLAALYDALDESETARAWLARSEAMRGRINALLWQPDRGFYRMHLLTTGAPAFTWPEDPDRLALGGNALAALYGIADDAQARRIFNQVEQRRTQLGISTVSGTLLPAYPDGVFAHPAMRTSYTYQNGGQWDWFGGRFVLAEFERGFATRARRHLGEIARKVHRNRGLHEWQTTSGRGRGSSHYAGSAGALGTAAIRGLFGVALVDGALTLTVRLGEGAGEVDLREPATEIVVRYDFRYESATRQVRLAYQSSAAGTGRLAVLLPTDATVQSVRLDGRPTSFDIRETGEDRFVAITTDWQPHELGIQLD